MGVIRIIQVHNKSPRCRTMNQHTLMQREKNKKKVNLAARAQGQMQMTELDEQLQEYIAEWRKQRQKEEEELYKLKEKQAKRKILREEEEKQLMQQKREEEERKQREETER